MAKDPHKNGHHASSSSSGASASLSQSRQATRRSSVSSGSNSQNIGSNNNNNSAPMSPSPLKNRPVQPSTTDALDIRANTNGHGGHVSMDTILETYEEEDDKKRKSPRISPIHPSRPSLRPFYNSQNSPTGFPTSNSSSSFPKFSFGRPKSRNLSGSSDQPSEITVLRELLANRLPSRRRVRTLLYSKLYPATPLQKCIAVVVVLFLVVLFSLYSSPLWWTARVFERGPGSSWRIDWVKQGASASGDWGKRSSSVRNPTIPANWNPKNQNKMTNTSSNTNTNANTTANTTATDDELSLNVRPNAQFTAVTDDPSVRYLAYNPHSGYHNQRISLENALVLAELLDRTLIVPPVWLGYQIPFISFDKMQSRITQATKFDAMGRCKSSLTGPLPPECVGFHDYTLVSWDFLVDLEEISNSVPIIERWDMTDEFFSKTPSEGGLGLSPRQWATVKEETLYEYKLFDDAEDQTHGLDKFSKRIDIDSLKESTTPYRLLQVGTLFGSSRIEVTKPHTKQVKNLARQAMVFKNPLLIEVSNTLMGLMGGWYDKQQTKPLDQYAALHLRLADGAFRENASENVWKGLYTLANQLGLKDEVSKKLFTALKKRHSPYRRVVADEEQVEDISLEKIWKEALAEPEGSEVDSDLEVSSKKIKIPAAPLKIIKSRKESPLSKSLSCRGALHTHSDLLPLNAPLYLATDSKIPSEDPFLAPVFQVFPCTYFLNDFFAQAAGTGDQVIQDKLKSLTRLGRVRNEDDGTPLGPFLVPYLDAMVAAKARHMVGTPHSTFSAFATNVLHQVYHGWEISESTTSA